jgi:hypothetical protein
MAIYVDGLGGEEQPINEEKVKQYIESEVQQLLSGAPQILDTLKELGDAINNDPNFASTLLAALQGKMNTTGGIVTGPITLPGNPTAPLHAATKGYVDTAISNIPDPILTLDGLTDVAVTEALTGQVLTFNGSYWYAADNDATGGATAISNAAVNVNGRLIITLSNGSTIDAGYVQGGAGATGPQGATGATGIGFANAVVDSSGNLILTKTDGAIVNAGLVKGAAGVQGATGAQGPQGATGTQGISITGAAVNGSGQLVLSLSNGSTINAGSTVGPQGPQGVAGPKGDIGDTGAQGPQGLTGATGAAGAQGIQGPQGLTGPAGADGVAPHNIALTGKVTGLATFDSSGNVSVTTALNGVTSSDIAEGTNQYFTNARARSSLSAGAGISYNASTGAISLNANTDQVPEGANNLYFTNNRFDNRLAQSNLMALADVANVTPTTGQALVWNGNTWAPGTVASSGGGGSSSIYKATARVEYDASGNLSSVSILDGNISAVIATATSTTATVTFTFTGSTSTPLGIQVYGYQRTNNVYVTRALASDFPTRTLLAGGTSGSPTAFDAFDSNSSTMTLGLTKAATGASAAVGQTTHCIIQFILSAV